MDVGSSAYVSWMRSCPRQARGTQQAPSGPGQIASGVAGLSVVTSSRDPVAGVGVANASAGTAEISRCTGWTGCTFACANPRPIRRAAASSVRCRSRTVISVVRRVRGCGGRTRSPRTTPGGDTGGRPAVIRLLRSAEPFEGQVCRGPSPRPCRRRRCGARSAATAISRAFLRVRVGTGADRSRGLPGVFGCDGRGRTSLATVSECAV